MPQSEVVRSESLGTDPFALGALNSSSAHKEVSGMSGAHRDSEHLSHILEALESRIDADSEGFLKAIDNKMQDLLSEAALGAPLESMHQSLSDVANKAGQSGSSKMHADLDAQVQCVSQACEALKPAQGNELSDDERARAQEKLLGMLDHGPFPPEVLAQLAPDDPTSTEHQFAQLVHHASTDADLTKAVASLNWEDVQMSPEDAARIFQEMMEETQLEHLMK
jgi:hypothetical protein